MNQPWSLINWVQSFFQSVHKKKKKKKTKKLQTATFPITAMTVAMVTKWEREPSQANQATVRKADFFHRQQGSITPCQLKKWKIFNNFILILQEELCMKSWQNDFGSERSTRKFSAVFISTTQQVTLTRTMSERLLTIGPGGPWGPSPPFKPAEPWKQKVHLH